MRWIQQPSDRPYLVSDEELRMPMNDWSNVKPGVYHNSRQLWTSSITNQLNSWLLPRGLLQWPSRSSTAIRSIVERLAQLLREGINLLVIDPFPPSVRDPRGIHALIWNENTDQPFELPKDRPLTIVSYQASPSKTAWVEPIAVGSPLPLMPLFFRNEFFINVPLETSYQQTWAALPIELKRTVAPSNSGG